MPRETMSERNSNPMYYQSIQCEQCGCTEGTFKRHAFGDDTMCIVCINVLLAEAAMEDEDNGRIYDEDRADEDRLEFLIQERAL